MCVENGDLGRRRLAGVGRRRIDLRFRCAGLVRVGLDDGAEHLEPPPIDLFQYDDIRIDISDLTENFFK